MDNAVYSASTGMLSRSRALDITANNMANANTIGFFGQKLTTATFGEYMTHRFSDGSPAAVGVSTHGCMSDTVYAPMSQGPLSTTGRSLDLAITGDGFFTISGADGALRLTRDGRFSTDEEGYLITASGDYVMAQGGRMWVGDAENVVVSETGEVQTPFSSAGVLRILTPENGADLKRLADGTYAYEGADAGFHGSVHQGALELSNVEVAAEMIDMIEASRAFQSCAQVIKMLDAVNQRMANEIGKV